MAAVEKRTSKLIEEGIDFSIWSILPAEIEDHIFNKLPKADRLKSRLVCKSWRDHQFGRGLIVNLSRFKHTDDALVNNVLTQLQNGNVQEVNLSYCYNVTDKSLQLIAERGTNVESLNLSNCWKITSAGMQHLSALKELKSLNLNEFKNINPECIENLVNNCPHLTDLNVSETDINDDCLKLISKLPLKSLNLRGCQRLTDTGFKYLTRSTTSLEVLNIRMNPISDRTLISISEGCPNLHEIDLSTTTFTSEGLKKLLEGCPLLENMVAFACTSLKDDGLD